MSTSSFDSAYVIGTTSIAVPIGATTPLYFGPQAYLMSTDFRMTVGGGTLLIVGANQGVTMAGATIAAIVGFRVGVSQIVTIPGPANFYLYSVGATNTVDFMMKYSQGASF